jgi:hypothetical protein
MSGDRNAEARVQAAIVTFVRIAVPDVIIFAVPNGGLRSKVEAARLKWTGVLAGVPDLAIVGPGGKAFFLEVKAPKGRASTQQKDVLERLASLGAQSAIVRSIDDVRRAFEAWQIPTREVRT